MKTNVYAIRDIVMKNYSLPFYAIHESHAKRICQDLVQRGEGTIVYDHPEDHDLYLIGEYDDLSGLISPVKYPEFVLHLSDFATPVGDKKDE